jgi:hypothetical protein
VSLTDPPSPLQVRVNVTGLSITIDCEPVTGFAPDQSPDAKQLLAPADDQLNVIVLPRLTLDGLEVRLRAGGAAAGGSFTVTVILSVALPPAPVQVRM